MVSVLAFCSDDPSSNHAEVYNFSVKLLLKRTKKRGRGWPIFFKKKFCLQNSFSYSADVKPIINKNQF